MSSVITRKLCLLQGQLQVECTHGVVILCDKSFAALQQIYFQIIQVLCNIHKQRQGLASILRTEIVTLACLFIHEVFNFLT